MSDWYTQLPACRAEGEERSVDEVKLLRDDVPVHLTAGLFTEALEFVKARPGETILLGFLNVMFGGGSSGCFDPSPLIELFDDSSNTGSESPDYTYDFASNLYGVLGTTLENLAIGGAVAVAVVFMLVFVLFLWTLQVGISGGTALFWLRLVRGQDATLNHAGKVVPKVLPLLATSALMWLGIVGGYLALIIPGLILYYGWMFTTYVVLDKNLTYRDALTASWRMTNGHKWSLLWVSVLIGLLNLGGLLLCCVGMFFTTAVTQGVMAILYNRLAEPGNAYLEHGEDVLSAFD